MDINQKYQEIINALKEGKRSLTSIKEPEFKELFIKLGEAFQRIEDENSSNLNDDLQSIERILCILEHSRNFSPIFEGLLCRLLKSTKLPNQLKIYALGASQGFIIQRRNFLGESLPGFYLETLELLLDSDDPELYEWNLRIIDETGNQGKKLAEKILKTRPRFLKMLNKHNRNSHDIIQMLIEKWGLRVR